MIDRPVVLVGFMAAGKSKIGRLLAERLGLAFFDTDREIETAFRKPVAQIFSEDGEPAFREAERRTIAGLLDSTAQVISVGGGAFVDPATRALLLARSQVIWLDPPFEIIRSRIGRSTSRPLASNKSDDELRALWVERCASYAEAHLRVVTSDVDPAVAVNQIVTALS